jgi:hypothetical protein
MPLPLLYLTFWEENGCARTEKTGPNGDGGEMSKLFASLGSKATLWLNAVPGPPDALGDRCLMDCHDFDFHVCALRHSNVRRSWSGFSG